MNARITYVCEKECDFSFDCKQILNYEIDVLNYPVDSGAFICTDILIFHYSPVYQQCLSEISHIRETYQCKPIILVSDRFDSKCLSWAISKKINNIIVLPDELKIFNSLLDDLLANSAYTASSNDGCVDDSVVKPIKQAFPKNTECKTRKAVHFIHNNYSSNIQLSKVAALCNMSVSTFTRTFKFEQGVTFGQYIQLLRFCFAKKLLRNTSLPINQIAYECGFSDPAYFSRLFRNSENLTPKEYRRNLQ